MDRKSLERLKLDRRLIRRRNWISSDELRRELDALPDVADKAAPIEVDGETTKANTPNSIYDFENALRKSKLFSSVKLIGPRALRYGKHSFAITAQLSNSDQPTARAGAKPRSRRQATRKP